MRLLKGYDEITKNSTLETKVLLFSRVRLSDNQIGTVCRAHSDSEIGIITKGVERRVSLSEIVECGDDVQHRASELCVLHSIKFVSLRSLRS